MRMDRRRSGALLAVLVERVRLLHGLQQERGQYAYGAGDGAGRTSELGTIAEHIPADAVLAPLDAGRHCTKDQRAGATLLSCNEARM